MAIDSCTQKFDLNSLFLLSFIHALNFMFSFLETPFFIFYYSLVFPPPLT